MKRAALLACAAAILALGAWLLLRPRARPNVLLVTIDTARADHIGRGKGLPAIEAFLDRATHFRCARAPAPLTLPSHLTMLTGLLPAHHGIHDNVAPPLPKDRGFPLLQEEMREAGYATAAFAACSVLGPQTGIGEGFQTFECPPSAPEFSGEYNDPPAEERVSAPLRWLENRRGSWFLWVHFFDPHAPYQPFRGDARREAVRAEAPDAVRYQGEIRRVDAALERLLAAVPEGTIVLVASDHGEGLFEHDEATHGPLCYGTTIDVFLAATGPGLTPGAEEAGPRGLADLAPTIRQWCGLPPRPTDGAPLTGPPLPVVVSESLHTWLLHGWGQCFSATDGRHSLVESGPRIEFFDRERDPREGHPLDARGNAAFERLDRAILGLRSLPGAPRQGSASGAATPYGMVRRPFSAYVSREENAGLIDPRQGFPRWILLETGSRLIYEGASRRDPGPLQEAIALFRKVAAEEDRSPAPFFYLMHAQARLAEVSGAPEWHLAAAQAGREAIRRGYLDPIVLQIVLREALLSGDASERGSALAAALEPAIVPDLECAESVVELALAIGDAEAGGRALAYLERARRRFPDPAAQARLADLRRRLP